MTIGTKVLWRTRSGKDHFFKRGTIIAEVPPLTDPKEVFDRHFRPAELNPVFLRHMAKSKRKAVSYLIREDAGEDRPKVYCPWPLERIQPA